MTLQQWRTGTRLMTGDLPRLSPLDLYKLDIDSYPTKDEGLKALVEQLSEVKKWDGPYLTRRDGIIDPWGHPYTYLLSSTGGDIAVLYYGADGKSGGTGEDADVTSDH